MESAYRVASRAAKRLRSPIFERATERALSAMTDDELADVQSTLRVLADETNPPDAATWERLCGELAVIYARADERAAREEGHA